MKSGGVSKMAKMRSFAFLDDSKILSPKSIVKKVSKNLIKRGGVNASKKVPFRPASFIRVSGMAL